MNKIFISLAALLSIGAIVFAQGPGGVGGPENRPGSGQGGGQGQGVRQQSGVAVGSDSKFVYVVSGGTLYQYSVDGLKLVAKTQLPTPERNGQGGGRRENPPTN